MVKRALKFGYRVFTFCFIIGVLLPTEVASQVSREEIPFSDEELLAAFRLVMSEDDAWQLLAAIRDTTTIPERDANIVGSTLTDDTLDLLASLSDDLAERVRVYRQRPWFRGPVPPSSPAEPPDP